MKINFNDLKGKVFARKNGVMQEIVLQKSNSSKLCKEATPKLLNTGNIKPLAQEAEDSFMYQTPRHVINAIAENKESTF